jgi:iron complex outermembrane receptor protein
MVMMSSHTLKTFIFVTLLCSGACVFAQDTSGENQDDKDEPVVEEMVITASKRPEKKMEAPSTVEKVGEDEMLRSAATTFSGALAQVKGIDFANGGINLQKISTRGFSSSFNSRMLSMIDGRLSTLPGAGLPQGGLSSVSALDIKSMELVLGPAGALYGSNTTAGVLNVITKTPWDEEGISLAAKGGEQSMANFRFRVAEIFGDNWGFKVTGEYLDADEFDSDNIFSVTGANQTAYESQAAAEADVATGLAYREADLVDEFTTTSKKYEVTGYYQAPFALFSASYGWSENDGFGVTNVGRNRIQGWEIESTQFKASADHWYFQYTRTEEDAGETYSIQSVPGVLAQGLAQGLSYNDALDIAQESARFINRSSLDDMELQGNYQFGDLNVVAGASYREYDPSSEGSYLADFILPNGERRDIGRDETGVYFQADYRAMDDKLRLVAAGRYDDFSEFDSQFSPKFGVTYSAGAHFFRANYMTSYRAPEIIENHLFFLGGIARGNNAGYDVFNANNDLVAGFDGLQPEEITTLEFGWRALLGPVYVDAVAYQSDYENFISPLQVIATPAFGTYAVSRESGDIIPFLLTYLNYGEAEIRGIDLGMDFTLAKNMMLKTSVSWSDLSSFDNNTTIPDIPFNTPEWKYKATLDWRDVIAKGLYVNVGARSVDSYDYLSGNWNGTVEAATVVDFATGYFLERTDTLFKLSISNLFDQDDTELLGTPAVPRFATFEVIHKF